MLLELLVKWEGWAIFIVFIFIYKSSIDSESYLLSTINIGEFKRRTTVVFLPPI